MKKHNTVHRVIVILSNLERETSDYRRYKLNTSSSFPLLMCVYIVLANSVYMYTHIFLKTCLYDTSTTGPHVPQFRTWRSLRCRLLSPAALLDCCSPERILIKNQSATITARVRMHACACKDQATNWCQSHKPSGGDKSLRKQLGEWQSV